MMWTHPRKPSCSSALHWMVSAATTASYSSASDPQGVIERGKRSMMRIVDEFLRDALDRRIELTKRHRAGEIAAEEPAARRF